ncbi:hypothetical protein B0H13DRAFT_1983139, partial [Mycena leptocephala]
MPLLLSVGEEYRPSPGSPSSAPKSEEEKADAPCVLIEEGTRRASGFAGDRAAACPWGSAALLSPEALVLAALAREPSPAPAVVPAPPPVSKVSFKEWQARRKLERAKEVEVAQGGEKERQRGLEREWEREKDAAGARTRRTRSSPRRLRTA